VAGKGKDTGLKLRILGDDMNRDKALDILKEAISDAQNGMFVTEHHTADSIEKAFRFLAKNPPPIVIPTTVKQMRQVLINELGFTRDSVDFEMRRLTKEMMSESLTRVLDVHIRSTMGERFVLDLAKRCIHDALKTSNLEALLKNLAREEAAVIVKKWLEENVEFRTPEAK
jgi:hypothetical protein